jgi:hypothetical protein
VADDLFKTYGRPVTFEERACETAMDSPFVLPREPVPSSIYADLLPIYCAASQPSHGLDGANARYFEIFWTGQTRWTPVYLFEVRAPAVEAYGLTASAPANKRLEPRPCRRATSREAERLEHSGLA